MQKSEPDTLEGDDDLARGPANVATQPEMNHAFSA